MYTQRRTPKWSPALRRSPLATEATSAPATSAVLNWPGKDASESASLGTATPARANWDLRGVLECGDRADGLLIRGEAGEAMAELLALTGERAVKGKVKLCYIDPP